MRQDIFDACCSMIMIFLTIMAFAVCCLVCNFAIGRISYDIRYNDWFADSKNDLEIE